MPEKHRFGDLAAARLHSARGCYGGPARCRRPSRAFSDYQRARRDRRISRAAQSGRRGRDGFALEVRGFALFRTSPRRTRPTPLGECAPIRTRSSFVPGMWKAGARSSRRGCHAVPLLPTLRLQLPAFCPSPKTSAISCERWRLCHGNERRLGRGQGPARAHAAATAFCHCVAASALKIRSVDRETRCR